MNEPIKSNLSSIITLVCVLLIGVIAYFYLNPAISRLKDLNTKVAAKDKEINLLTDKINNLTQLQIKFNQNQAEVKELQLAAPSSDQVADILVELEAIGAKSGVKINSIQPSKDTQSSQVPVNVSVQGDYLALTNFVAATEKNIRPISIKSINLTSSAQAGGGVIINGNFSLNILRTGSN